jgi:hypothetical protein
MITTAKSSRLLLHCCVQPLLRAPFGYLWPQALLLLWALCALSDRCSCSSRRYIHVSVHVSTHRALRWCCPCLHFCCLRCFAPPKRLLVFFGPPCLLPSPALVVCHPMDGLVIAAACNAVVVLSNRAFAPAHLAHDLVTTSPRRKKHPRPGDSF